MVRVLLLRGSAFELTMLAFPIEAFRWSSMPFAAGEPFESFLWAFDPSGERLCFLFAGFILELGGR